MQQLMRFPLSAWMTEITVTLLARCKLGFEPVRSLASQGNQILCVVLAHTLGRWDKRKLTKWIIKTIWH